MATPTTQPLESAAPAITRLRLMTVNVHKGFSFLNRRFVLPELREAVRAGGADLVFLQEVHGSQHKHARSIGNWPATPHYEFLADTMWGAFAYGRNAVYPDGDHGNAVLSKFPIVQHRNLDVSIGDGSENRGLLHCVLDLPGRGPLHAICVHLGLREPHRQRQLGLLCALLSELPATAPVVVAGDFNDWRGRASQVLRHGAGLREAFEAARGTAARTFPARLPVLRLDRIYTRNLTTTRPEALARRPWSHLSDHVPLVAEVQL